MAEYKPTKHFILERTGEYFDPKKVYTEEHFEKKELDNALKRELLQEFKTEEAEETKATKKTTTKKAPAKS